MQYQMSTDDPTGSLAVIVAHLSSYGIDLWSSVYAARTLTIQVSEALPEGEPEHLGLTEVA